MNVKMTVKVGDHVETMTEEQTKMFTGTQQGFEQLLEAKGGISMLMKMMGMEKPDQAEKRIEIILEFDDGQYMVIGKKPKDFDDGR